MNKNVLILGDSYSTFEGYIPEGYGPYYPGSQPGGPHDVTDVNHTWWKSYENETGNKIVLNNSWSGSTICNTGYEGKDCSKTSSFIFRLNQLIENKFFDENKIDLFIIFGGTNDSWANSPLGELKFSDFTEEDLYSALPAIAYVVKTAKEKTNVKDILFVINSELKKEIEDAEVQACLHYGIRYLKISENTDKLLGHPTRKGMAQIKEQIKSATE